MRCPYRVTLRHPDDIQVTTYASKESRAAALVSTNTPEEEANDAQGMR